MAAKIPTIEIRGRKWKVWIVDETDVTVTVRVRPLRIMDPAEFTLPFRAEFNDFDNLAAEAVDRYLGNAPPPRARACRLHGTENASTMPR